MALIKKDSKGIYAKVGGWIVRPITPTIFKEGQQVEGHHFRGSSKVGMGKRLTKGQFIEYWKTSD